MYIKDKVGASVPVICATKATICPKLFHCKSC